MTAVLETPIETATATSFTMYAAELARVLGNVLPHAGQDDTMPMLRVVGIIPAADGFAAVATDRYTLAVSVGVTSDQRGPIPNAYTVMREGTAPLIRIDSRECKALIADLKRLKLATVHVGECDGRVVVGTSDLSYQRTISQPDGEFPRFGQLAKPLDEYTGIDGAIGISPANLAKFAKVVPTPGTGGVARKSTAPLLFQFSGSNRPVLVTVGSEFAAIVMPTRLAG